MAVPTNPITIGAMKACLSGFLFGVLAVMLLPNTAFAASAPKLVEAGDHYDLSYKIDVPPEHDYWISIRDALRAGQTVAVYHNIEMREQNTFFGGHIAKARKARYVSYNLFENTYAYGTAPDDMRQTTRREEARDFLYGVTVEDFTPIAELKKATVYDIEIRLKLDENIHTEGLLFFDGLFNHTLTRQFTHVAR